MRVIFDLWWLFFIDCLNFYLYINIIVVVMVNRYRVISMFVIVFIEDDRGGWVLLFCIGLGNVRDGGDSGGEILIIFV